MRYSLRKYIDSSEVFNRVKASLKSYFDSDMIITDDYYKTIDWCNTQMGIKINPTKEIFIPIENYSAVLPDDFLLLELALSVGTRNVVFSEIISKTETLTDRCPTTKDLQYLRDKCCNFNLVCGRVPILTCETETLKIEFPETFFYKLIEKKYATDSCFNIYTDSPQLMEIKNGIIYTDGIEEGLIYLQYTATINNEDNIPQCLDNNIALEFYEQTLKYRMLQDLYINKRLEVAQAIPMVKEDYIKAKNDALSLVSTPEIGELISVGKMLQRRFNKRNVLR